MSDKQAEKSIILELFLTFAKIGLFTFGGGLAMVSLIDDICVEKKKWITHDEMMDATVIAESTPGPIAINCATFIGHRQGGMKGAIAATVGVIMPSFLIILIISSFIDKLLEIPIVENAFFGIKIAVGILILDVAIKMIRKMEKKRLPIIIMISAFVVMMCINVFSWNFSSISLILIAAAVSLCLYFAGTAHNRKGGGV